MVEEEQWGLEDEEQEESWMVSTRRSTEGMGKGKIRCCGLVGSRLRCGNARKRM